MDKVKHLDLIFENCDYLRLFPENIKYLCFDLIRENISINNYQYKDGEVTNRKIISDFYLQIINWGNLKTEMEETDVFKRISSNDIAQITLYFDNGLNENYHIVWGEKHDQINEFQVTALDCDKILVIIKEWTK